MTEMKELNSNLLTDPKSGEEAELSVKKRLKTYTSIKSDFKIFVPDNSDVVSTLWRVTIICTCFMLIELFGGYYANSVAVISDALHLSIDIIGYFIQIMSANLAMRRND